MNKQSTVNQNTYDSTEPDFFMTGVKRLIENQLRCLLKVVNLESHGELAGITAFELNDNHETRFGGDLSKPKKPGNGVYQNVSAYRFIEPRLLMISHFLRFITRLGLFFQGELPVKINGFRLANLHYWARYKVGAMLDSLGCICSYCDAQCEFCFRKGSPFIKLGHKMLNASEAKTLLNYYDPRRNTGLPVPLHDTGDIFLNPQLLEILTEIRRRAPKEVIYSLTTHGNHLNPDTIRKLAELKPIFPVVSLNSMVPETRAKAMKAAKITNGINAIPLLRQYGISYIGSIVPWPSIGLDDMEESIRFLDAHDAYLIRICLPSFTKYSHQPDPFDTNTYWSSLASRLKKIRGEISAPLLIQPSWYLRQEVKAHIDGVIKNSPAFRAGFCFGDRIMTINGESILTRHDVVRKLEHLCKERREIAFTIERQGRIMPLCVTNNLTMDDDAYPYKPSGYEEDPHTLLGLFFIDGFPLESMVEMSKIIANHPDAQKILVFTTKLGKNLLVQNLAMLLQTGVVALPVEKIRVTIAEHCYWGGNIMIGDLHTVDDYIQHIRKLKSTGYTPDLVLIPSSFTLSQWQMDVLGKSYLNIQRETGCKVELIPTQPVKR